MVLPKLLAQMVLLPLLLQYLPQGRGGAGLGLLLFTVLWSFQMRWWSRGLVLQHPSAPVLLRASTEHGQVLIPAQLRTIPFLALSLVL